METSGGSISSLMAAPGGRCSSSASPAPRRGRTGGLQERAVERKPAAVSAAQESQDRQEDHRTDHRGYERADKAAHGRDAKMGQQVTTRDGADHTDHQVPDEAETPALDDVA